jgi:single-strand DNA-binding protein
LSTADWIRAPIDGSCAHHGAMTSRDRSEPDSKNPDGPDNTVFLRGRLAADPVARELPSGDELLSFRLTVARPPEQPAARSRVDSIDCATSVTRARRCLERATPGDVVEVTGTLQRRFWRSAGGLGSRYEVQVATARVSRRRKADA